jgi:WD40 repeat protein
MPDKIVSIAIVGQKLGREAGYAKSAQLTVACANRLYLFGVYYNMTRAKGTAEPKLVELGCISGHSSPVRSLALGPSVLASCSADAVRLWDLETSSAIGTVDTQHVLSSTILADESYLIT